MVLAYSVPSDMEERICPILVNGGPNKKKFVSFNLTENPVLPILQDGVNCKVTVQRTFETPYAASREIQVGV